MGPRSFRRPASRSIFRILAFSLRHCHRGPQGVKLFSRVGHQEAKCERITTVSSWVEVGSVGPSRVSGFFFYRHPTHIVCLYLYTYQQTAGGGRPWIDGLAICPANHTQI